MARWTWDPDKARTNLRNHKVSFELAERTFGDPLVASRRDPYPDEERWQSIGKPSSDSFVILFVVHTEPVPQPDGEEEGRIISARRATTYERRVYEEGEF
ncbi:MAG TPA: BrnT family toxin [Acidisphaera sp.]|nr:BrnT family toxin [Acidisphaera sp.]